MGFLKKTPRAEQCPMCDALVDANERLSHELSHVALITDSDPAWLPPHMRQVAQGEYTFKCDRCNSFPDIKWPKEGGASAGMQLHLGHAHGRGPMAHASIPAGFGMVEIA